MLRTFIVSLECSVKLVVSKSYLWAAAEPYLAACSDRIRLHSTSAIVCKVVAAIMNRTHLWYLDSYFLGVDLING